MNDALLALIAELYAQVAQLRQENQQLTDALSRQQPAPPTP